MNARVLTMALLSAGLLAALHFSRTSAEPAPPWLQRGAAAVPRPLLALDINPESRVKVGVPDGPISVRVGQWHPFAVRVQNAAGVRSELRVRAVESQMGAAPVTWAVQPGPQGAHLTGAPEETRTLWVRADRSGDHAVSLAFDVGQGTQDLGFRAEADLLLRARFEGEAGAPLAAQPLVAQVRRLRQTLEALGEPLPAGTLERLDRAAANRDPAIALKETQEALDRHCLVLLDVAQDGRMEARPGSAPPVLHEQGWRTFLVKVHNRPGLTGSLRVTSPAARPVPNGPPGEVDSRWMDLNVVETRPLSPTLSGLAVEYRILQVYSRDAGKRSGDLTFNIGRFPAGSAPAGLIREWRFPQDAASWRMMNQARLEPLQGALRVESTGEDPYIGTDVSAPGGKLVLRFRARVDRPDTGQLFWWTQQRPEPSGAFQRVFRLDGKPDQFRDYTVRFNVAGELRGLRLDTPSAPSRVDLESISLSYEDEPAPESASLNLAFTSEPSQVVHFRVRDENGKPATAAFEVRDDQGRVYPSQAKRLAPDFFFHAQVYRHDGETLRLPAGTYTVRCSRGPESLTETLQLQVADRPVELAYRVRRWIDPSERGWFSGDHHIHAAGCAHYTNPTEGVLPEHMARHILGEDLKVGANLTWGPCFDYQKQFFTGKTDEQSRYPYLLRYDIEVSGFGSHQSGHLCLLRLKDQMYPGGTSKSHWPTLGLNTLRWAKRQGALTGPAHSGNGLAPTRERLAHPDGPNGLPNYAIPGYNGIGANEFIVDITHEVPGPDGKPVPAVDFISTMDTDPRAELNMWYHALNCGFRTRASGETDFPCISGERVGLGRVYVHQAGRLTYEGWCEGIRQGRSYVSDGRHHLMDFRASAGSARASLASGKVDLSIPGPASVAFEVRAAARHPEGGEVPVELIVNGYPAGRHMLPRDGKQRTLKWDVNLDRSSWVAIRAFPGAHTNPIWVTVAGAPFQPDRRSVEWALRGVDQCWRQKEATYANAEKQQAAQAYEHARTVYRNLLSSQAGK